MALGLIAGSLVLGGGSLWVWHEQHHAERVLVLASGPRLSEFHGFAVALSKVVNAYEPRFNIRVIETYGSEENLTLLADGTAQLALVAGSTPLTPDTAVVGFLFPEVFHLIVRDGLGIARVPDLRGFVVGLPPSGSTSRTLFWRLIRHYGLGPADIKILTVEPREAKAALRDGSVDAYFLISALGSPLIADLLADVPTTLVPIEQAAALRLSIPALSEGEIPTGTYDGARPVPSGDLPSVAERTLLVGTSSLPPGDAYAIARVLGEGRQDLVAADLRAALIRPVADPFDEGLPIHSGAAEYFSREKPFFIVQYAETMGFLLSAGVLFGSTLWHLKLMADRRSKNRADNYNSRIIELTEKAQAAKTLGELEVIRQELLSTFKRVFSDLDEDRISSTSIQGFTLAWYTAVQIVEHRQTVLPDAVFDERRSARGGYPAADVEGATALPMVAAASAKPAA